MMWMQYPKTEALYGVDDQYLIGSDLLVKPIVSEGETSAEVRFPTNDIWYDAESLEAIPVKPKADSVETMRVQAPLDKIPVFQRGGSIIPRKLRLRRSAMLMKADPYTLYVALDSSKMATGKLYMDDEETFSYNKRSEYALSTFTADLGATAGTSTLKNNVSVGSGWEEMVEKLYNDRMIERIVIMGLADAPKSIQIDGDKLDFSHKGHLLVIRKPELPALAEWTITFVY
jgi:alpha 1,3-glucosidase